MSVRLKTTTKNNNSKTTSDLCLHHHHHHHHSCPTRSDKYVIGAFGVTADQTPMHRCFHTLDSQATAAAGLAFLSFLAWRLMSSWDSRLSSKSWAPLWLASLQALRSAARCSQPLTRMPSVSPENKKTCMGT